MRILSAPSARQVDLGLAILRLVLGATFIAHGSQKLFVYGIDGVTGGFTQMGIPMAGLAAPLVAFVEFAGGIALVLGLLTRLAGLGLAITMLGAIWFAHLSAGFFLPNGYEFALSLLAPSVLLALTGAGRYSLDSLIEGRLAYRSAALDVRAGQARRAA
jgi:putative oxidoreductase